MARTCLASLIHGAVLSVGAMVAGAPSAALAQDYPVRPIELVVPYAPGGSSDVTARLLAEPLGRALGQPVLVVNKPGASSIVGEQYVATSKPDGYTLLANTAAHTVIANKPGLGFDVVKSFVPITRFVTAPYLLVVNPEALPVANVQELVAMIKAAPGKYNYASTGVGASAHLAAELLKSLAGIDITHVPYPGGAGPGVQATIAGQTQLTFASPAGATMAAIEEGQLRALAVSSATRWDGMPDLPTVAEQGVDGFEVDYWTALFAPAGTPPDIVEKISSAVRTALDDPVLSEQYSKLHYSKPYQSPQEFGAYVEKDVEKWGRIIKSANIPL